MWCSSPRVDPEGYVGGAVVQSGLHLGGAELEVVRGAELVVLVCRHQTGLHRLPVQRHEVLASLPGFGVGVRDGHQGRPVTHYYKQTRKKTTTDCTRPSSQHLQSNLLLTSAIQEALQQGSSKNILHTSVQRVRTQHGKGNNVK